MTTWIGRRSGGATTADTYRLDRDGTWVRVVVQGDLTAGAAPTVYAAIVAGFKTAATVEVDLARVPSIAPAGVMMLRRAARHARRHDVTMVVVGADEAASPETDV